MWDTLPQPIRENRPHTQAGNLGLNPICSTNYLLSLGPFLNLPKPRLPPLEDGDNRIHLTEMQKHLAQGLRYILTVPNWWSWHPSYSYCAAQMRPGLLHCWEGCFWRSPLVFTALLSLPSFLVHTCRPQHEILALKLLLTLVVSKWHIHKDFWDNKGQWHVDYFIFSLIAKHGMELPGRTWLQRVKVTWGCPSGPPFFWRISEFGKSKIKWRQSLFHKTLCMEQ